MSSFRRFCDKRWVPSRIPTVGVDFGSKQVQDTGQQVLHLDFFDLAGAPEYAAVSEDIYADAQGVVFSQTCCCFACFLLPDLGAFALCRGCAGV